MQILVVLRPVQDPLGQTVHRKAQKVFVHRRQTVLNPADRNALEAGLRLGGPVTAVAFGAGPAEQVLRDARAVGASRAIQVPDERVAEADARALTRLVCRLVDHLGGADLVLLGADCLDADLAQVGPRLAECLGRPFLGDVHQLQIEPAGLTAIAARGRGFRRLQADLPAVAAVARDSNQPRLPAAGDLIRMYTDSAAVETIRPAQLALDDDDLTPAAELRGLSFPAEREPGRRLDGQAAAELADVIRRF